MPLTMLIEKFAVVRNDHDRAGIRRQIFLEPEQRLEVEMVGRFVEHQQVRLLHEQPRQVRAHHPAAAHFARRAVKILFAKAEAGQNLLRLRFQLIAAQFMKAVVRVVVDFLHVIRCDVMVGIPGQDEPAELDKFRRDGRGQFQHRFIAGRRAFLRQIAEHDVAFLHDLAGVRLLLAEDDGKERGLPRAVRADQPDAVLAVQLQGHVGEQHPSAVSLADFRKSHHRNGSIT